MEAASACFSLSLLSAPTVIAPRPLPPRRKRISRVSASAAPPVYTPTPPDRHLRTPHSGYHFDGSTRQFFEGWYFKVSIPERRQSFCFMYAVDNPAFRGPLTALEAVGYGARSTGAAAQILGADDKLLCHFSPESRNFWGSRHELALGHTFVAAGEGVRPPNKEVPPQEFNRRVGQGFQVTPLWHQGFICDDGRNDFAETVSTARWEYSTRPIYGWGDIASKQKSTAGWLAAFPVFEPHWQICMASGLSTGWIEWDGERYEFEDAPSYSEKNWGGGFPRKWFWVQCNVFEGMTGEVALTAAGGVRQLPGPTETFENAALVGVHYEGNFYEFVPWTGNVSWEVKPWGFWHMTAENRTHVVEFEVTADDPGSPLRTPTVEAGFAPACRDTCYGVMRLQMWERWFDGSKGKVILDVTSDMAAAEVGGGPWFNTWKGKTTTPELLRRALNLPVDIDGMYGLVPFFKPPGWIEWDGERYEFEDAPSYSEKNWGGGFPRKWFWVLDFCNWFCVQCNVFEGMTGEVALTAAGALRQLPGLTETFENAALVGIHYEGNFYEFVPWTGIVSWEVKPWGFWLIAAENRTHVVELEVTADDPGSPLRAPTVEAGFSPACRDTCYGVLKLKMWERRYDGSKGKVVLDVTSDMAAAEVGGGPWFNPWKGKTTTPELLRRALDLPVDIDGMYGLVPFFKPPGL